MNLTLAPARLPILVLLMAMFTQMSGCSATRPGKQAYERRGDEIMVAGQLFHTGAPVVLWTDPGGYDAYRVEKRFVSFNESSWQASGENLNTPNRYGQRHGGDWPEPILEQIRGGGWDLPLLQRTVDQFVIHYDVCGTAAQCFNILHDHRGLSVHFMLDLDGTIYQTLDLKERAWHAGVANDRSIGIEIANIGAYPVDGDHPLDRWYRKDDAGRTINTPPQGLSTLRVIREGGSFLPRPAREEPVVGEINGRELIQYDLTPQQYESLEKLTAALCRIFPNLRRDVPRDEAGRMITDRPLTPEELADYQGLIGHHHITNSKVDPGPAFQWDRLIRR